MLSTQPKLHFCGAADGHGQSENGNPCCGAAGSKDGKDEYGKYPLEAETMRGRWTTKPGRMGKRFD